MAKARNIYGVGNIATLPRSRIAQQRLVSLLQPATGQILPRFPVQAVAAPADGSAVGITRLYRSVEHPPGSSVQLERVTVPQGTQLTVFGFQNSSGGLPHFYVQLPDGNVGYVPTAQLRLLETFAPTVEANSPFEAPPGWLAGNISFPMPAKAAPADGSAVGITHLYRSVEHPPGSPVQRERVTVPQGTQLIIYGFQKSSVGLPHFYVQLPDGNVGYVPTAQLRPDFR